MLICNELQIRIRTLNNGGQTLRSTITIMKWDMNKLMLLSYIKRKQYANRPQKLYASKLIPLCTVYLHWITDPQ